MDRPRQLSTSPADGIAAAATVAPGAGAGRLDGFSLGLVVLVMLFVAVATASNLPLEESFARRNLAAGENVADTSYLLTRAPREALLVALNLFLVAGFIAPRYRCRVTPGSIRMLTLIVAWIAICAAYSAIVKNLPLTGILLGLKFLLQTPLFFAGYLLARRSSERIVERFAALLRWYVALLFLITLAGFILRVASGRPLGVRYVGVFLNPNAYGVTLVACALWFLSANLLREQRGEKGRFWPWILACVVLSLATGSRLASTLTLLALVLMPWTRIDLKLKKLAIGLAPLLMVGILLTVSKSGVARHKVDRSTTSRLAIAEEVVGRFARPSDVVFGFGVGLASGSTVIVLGRDELRGQIGNVHSAILELATSFGLGGVLIFLTLLGLSLARGPSPQMDFFVLVVGAACLVINPWGIAPAGALLCMLWGALFAIGVQRRTAAIPAPA